LSNEQALAKLKEGEIDVLARGPYVPGKITGIDFSLPLYQGVCYSYYRQGIDEPKELKDLAKLRIGVIPNSYHYFLLLDQLPAAKITKYKTVGQQIAGAIKGDVDVIILDAPETLKAMATPAEQQQLLLADFTLGPMHCHAVIRQGEDELLEQINQGIIAISQAEKLAIAKKWMPESVVSEKPEPTEKPTQESTKVIIASSKGSAPFHFVDKDGKPVGMFIDFWKLWSKRTKTPIEFKPDSWGGTLQLMKEGKAQIHAGLFYSGERDTYLDYGSPLHKSDTHFFFHKSLFGIKDLEDLMPFKIGIVKGDFAVDYMKNRLPGASLALYAGNEALFDAIEGGEIKVFIKDTPISIYHLSQRGLLEEFKYYPDQPLYDNMFYAAVRQGDEKLLSLVNDGMKLITQDERAAIVRQWMGVSDIKTADVLVIALATDYLPFSGVDGKGKPIGLFVDLWRLWAKKTNKKIEFLVKDWVGTLNAVKNGEADIHSGLFYSEQRDQWLDFSQSFYQIDTGIFYPKKRGAIRQIEELFGRRVGVARGTFQAAYLRSKYPQVNLKLFNTDSEMIEAAVNGEIDACMVEVVPAKTIMLRKGVYGLFDRMSLPRLTNKVFTAVLPANKDLLAVINQGLNQISLDEWQSLEDRWVVDSENKFYAKQREEIKLNQAELDWLDKHKEIRLGVDPAFQPFEFFDAAGHYKGISSDYISYFNNQLGTSMESVADLTWPQVLAKTKAGEIDVLPCVAVTGERLKYLNFTKPYAIIPIVVVAREDAPFLNSLEELGGKKLAVAKDYAAQEYIQNDFPHYDYLLVDSVDEGLLSVSKGQVFAFVANLASVNFNIKKLGLKDLKVVIMTPYKLPLSLGVRKDWPILVKILNKQLRGLSKEEKDDIYDRWVNVYFERQIDWGFITRALVLGGFIAGLILLVILFWNRSLAKEIRERKRAEAALEVASRAKSDFLANMSHELRSPLNAVIGFSEMMHDQLVGPINEKQKEYLSDVLVSAHHLLELINDVLDLLKIESGKMELSLSQVSLVQLLENSLVLIKEKAVKHHIKLIPEIDPNIGEITADERKLKQAMFNLLSNAAKFTPDGGTIGIKAKRLDGLVEVTVWDTGIGLAKENLGKVFEEFVQVETTYSKKYAGTGLGMPLTKKIVELHGGKLWVESEGEGKGTKFVFTLPLDLGKQL